MIRRDEIGLRIWVYVCSVVALMTQGSTVFVQFILGGRNGPDPPLRLPRVHPPRRLPLCSSQEGKFSPDVTSNKRKAAGIGGGIRPIFCVTP